VMQQVMNRYVRYFNRTRRRDGPLCRARYMSIPIRSTRHLLYSFRYLDQNAPSARLPQDGEVYPFGSERWYRSERRPPWLSTAWADARMGNPPPERRAEAYVKAIGRKLTTAELEVLNRRIEHPTQPDDDWDSLIGAAPPRVLDWMRRKARLADGTKPGLPYVGADDIEEAVREESAGIGAWKIHAGKGRPLDGWMLLKAGLMRDLAGLTHEEIASHCECSAQSAVRRVRRHAENLTTNQEYAARASAIAARCLRDPT